MALIAIQLLVSDTVLRRHIGAPEGALMGNTLAKRVEAEILGVVSAVQPIDMDRLIQRVRETDPSARSVNVKIAAFNLVSKGQLGLNEQWELSRPAGN